MGKPISGQNQYPFTVGGIICDGAKINGNTFVKNIYIYKQSASWLFDLIDEQGNIYKDVRLTWRNQDNMLMNYFDTPSYLVETIPENTFFIKVQQLDSDKYGFLTMIQLNKLKVSTGQYIFYDINMDQTLLGVTITPYTATVQKGETIDFHVSFIPGTFPLQTGRWSSRDKSIISVEPSRLTAGGNTMRFLANNVGETSIYFIPDANTSRVGMAYVYVIEGEVKLNSMQAMAKSNITYGSNTSPFYMPGEEFQINLMFDPIDYVPTKDLYVPPSVDDKVEYLGTDDFINYKFKVRENISSEQYLNITATFIDGNITAYANYRVGTASTNPAIMYNTTFIVPVGKSIQLFCEQGNSSVTWKTESPDIATVDATGKINGLKVGNTKCTATFPNGKSTTVNISVDKVAVEYYSYSPYATKVLAAGDSVSTEVKWVPENAIPSTTKITDWWLTEAGGNEPHGAQGMIVGTGGNTAKYTLNGYSNESFYTRQRIFPKFGPNKILYTPYGSIYGILGTPDDGDTMYTATKMIANFDKSKLDPSILPLYMYTPVYNIQAGFKMPITFQVLIEPGQDFTLSYEADFGGGAFELLECPWASNTEYVKNGYIILHGLKHGTGTITYTVNDNPSMTRTIKVNVF